jgi:two-component system, chemotaxis family, sensor kinase CheA
VCTDEISMAEKHLNTDIAPSIEHSFAATQTLQAAFDAHVEPKERMHTDDDQLRFTTMLVADPHALPTRGAPRASTPAEAKVPAVEPDDEDSPELVDVLVDGTHPIYSEDYSEIVESFLVEATEILDNLDTKLLILGEHDNDRALVDEIFRDVHTVKGSAGFMNLQQLSHIAHHFEDVLNRLRRGDIEFHPTMLDVMFEAHDQMKVLALQVKNRKLAVVEQCHLIQKLSAISTGAFKAETAAESGHNKPEQDASEAALTPSDAGDGLQAGATMPGRAFDRSTETIRVEVHRLDILMSLVSELTMNRNRLVRITNDLRSSLSEEIQHDLLETCAQLDVITAELQTGLQHTRVVQIGRIFNKFPRVVRDLARSINKEIELVIEGAETEFDKLLTEEIGDPLVHLLRNSIDHGIELPAVRIAAGKLPVGTIRLAARHEGDHIIIEVTDDGAGIDVDRVKRKASEQNLITEAEAIEMSDADAFLLILMPGFSTAEHVNSLSGRGVGMDVVKTHIARLNGTIAIHSEMGKGTSVKLKFPLTWPSRNSCQYVRAT